ncbi:MAG: phosphoribosyl-AMP cyclohydrolase [Bacteroidota bacterium]
MMLQDNYKAIALEEGIEFTPQFDKRGGLLPVAVQETDSGQILMLASLNAAALRQTIQTGLATFWSTSRNKLWVKGETSGDFLVVDAILVDCDQDAFVYQVTLQGNGVCHTYGKDGKHRKACFYRNVDTKNSILQFIEDLK